MTEETLYLTGQVAGMLKERTGKSLTQQQVRMLKPGPPRIWKETPQNFGELVFTEEDVERMHAILLDFQIEDVE